MGIINSARIGLKKKEIANLESTREMYISGSYRDREGAENIVAHYDKEIAKSERELAKLESKN